MSDAKYDPELCERLVREARVTIETYRRDPWRMSDPFVIAESYARLTAMADQLEAARREVERLQPELYCHQSNETQEQFSARMGAKGNRP